MALHLSIGDAVGFVDGGQPGQVSEFAGLRASDAGFGEHFGEDARRVVDLLEQIMLELSTSRSMLQVLRRATFADVHVVRDTLRYGFNLPHLLTLCGQLLSALGRFELFETVARRE